MRERVRERERERRRREGETVGGENEDITFFLIFVNFLMVDEVVVSDKSKSFSDWRKTHRERERERERER